MLSDQESVTIFCYISKFDVWLFQKRDGSLVTGSRPAQQRLYIQRSGDEQGRASERVDDQHILFLSDCMLLVKRREISNTTTLYSVFERSILDLIGHISKYQATAIMEIPACIRATSVLGTISLLILLGVLYVVALAIYRLIWHPLAKFPGPRLAAMTGWYETYFDCFLLGEFSNHIDEMHRSYGIFCAGSTAIESHYNLDRFHSSHQPVRSSYQGPRFFDKTYTMTPKLDKDSWYYNFAGIPRSAFATPKAQLHRFRRAATAKIFSTSHALRMQPLVQSCVVQLILKLEQGALSNVGQPFDMSHLYSCMASQVVSGCIMSRPSNHLTSNDAPKFGKMFKTLARVALWNRHVPWFFAMVSAIPHGLVRRTIATLIDVLNFQEVNLSNEFKGVMQTRC